MPNIRKTLPIIKSSGAFTDILHRVVGISIIPLSRVVRENVVPARPIPDLAIDRHYSEKTWLGGRRDGRVRFVCTSTFY